MNVEAPILNPVVTLVCWSLIMWIWLYATRIPAVMSAKIKLDSNAPNGEQMAQLPPNLRWKADNYNHLMEQPTIFYAVALALALLGEGAGVNYYLAWAYVLLRVVHSFVQVLGNKIEVRFAVFILSNIPLLGLAVNAVLRIT